MECVLAKRTIPHNAYDPTLISRKISSLLIYDYGNSINWLINMLRIYDKLWYFVNDTHCKEWPQFN